MEDTKRAVAYLRVSTSMQVDGYSLDAQMTSIKRYAKAYDIDIVDVYKDEGRSGKSIAGREDFIRMLEDIETGAINVDYVMVYKLSRFGRNSADILYSLQRLQLHNVNLICTEEQLVSTGFGKMMLTVLSAVAELERETIVEQTMSGRKQKAEEGKWNGGFPPYGFGIKDGILIINEEEAEAIRIIYKKYLEGAGFNAISKYLRYQGIDKKPRHNGKHTQWSAKLIKDIIDNPVYCGKIAYGRRTKKKKKGTANEYQTIKQDTYIIAQGKHEPIISEEDWIAAQQRREETGVSSPSSIGRTRTHLLSGILRCPECGGPMYTNKNSWTKKDGTYVERHYYVCSRAYHARGIDCKYKASLREDVVEKDVIDAIKALAIDQGFEEEIKAKIGKEFDTTELDKELAKYEVSLKQATTVKTTIEREIDTLPYDAPHRERKLVDLNKRLDKAYDELVEIESMIHDIRQRRAAIRSNVLSVEQIYSLLEHLDILFDKLTDEEKRQVVSSLVKEVEVTKKDTARDKSHLKSITFNFPIYYDGNVGDKLLWEKGTHVESCVLITRDEK